MSRFWRLMHEYMTLMIREMEIREEGRAEGRTEGAIKEAIRLYRDELNLMPSEIIRRIMGRFDLQKEEAEKHVEETLGLQLV